MMVVVVVVVVVVMVAIGVVERGVFYVSFCYLHGSPQASMA